MPARLPDPLHPICKERNIFMELIKYVRRRGLALALSLVMVLSFMPATAFAAEAPDAETAAEEQAAGAADKTAAPLEDEAEDVIPDESEEESEKPEGAAAPAETEGTEGPGAEDAPPAGAGEPEEPDENILSGKNPLLDTDAMFSISPLFGMTALPGADEAAEETPADVQAFLDAVAALPDPIETVDEYDAVEAAMQTMLPLYTGLSEEAQEREDVEGAITKLFILGDQLGNMDRPTPLALISGEQFTVSVVKVVNGQAVDRVTLTKKCLQSTGHSGYNHSTNLRDLANSSFGLSNGYVGYNWSKYTTVPSSYTSKRPDNNNYASVHYNVVGSAPYDADETLFLFYENKTTYTLNYNANGGSGAPGTQTQTNNKSFTISSTKPTRAGFTFLGWSTSSTAASPSYYAGGTINVNGTSTTLYAVWEKQAQQYSYQLIYNVNSTDGSGGPGQQSATTTETSHTFSVSPQEPTRDGYIFQGWSTSKGDNNTVDYIADDGYTLYSTNPKGRLYAVWEKVPEQKFSYTITWYYTKNGDTANTQTGGKNLAGAMAPVKPIEIPETKEYNGDTYEYVKTLLNGAEITRPTSGYQFEVESDKPNQLDIYYELNTKPVEPEPETCTVTYTDGVAEETVFEDQSTTVNKNAQTPAFNGTPTRDGYTFTGWDPEVADTVTDNVTYTAQWKKNDPEPVKPDPETFTVTYTDGVAEETVFEDQSTIVDKDAQTPAFNGTPTRDGYTFTGWSPEVADTVTDNVTYTAQWTEIPKPVEKVTVTWKNGYNDDPVKTEQVDKGITTVSEDLYPEVPTRPGYTFDKWSEPVVDADGNISITATWTKNPDPTRTIALRYNGNGAEQSSVPGTQYATVKVGASCQFTVSSRIPARDGYTFAGWSDGTKTYQPEDKITVSSNTTLTAQWAENVSEPEQVTVTWKNGYNEDPIKTEQIDKGTDPAALTYPEDPAREGYTFTGWSEPVIDEDGSITITAQWTENEQDPEPATHTVTWVDGVTGEVIDSAAVEDGTEQPANPAVPVHPGYVFDSWVTRVDEDGNVTITASYSEVIWTPIDPTTPAQPANPGNDDDDDEDDDNNNSQNTTGTTGGSGDAGEEIADPEVPLAGVVGLNTTDHIAYMIGRSSGVFAPNAEITRAEVATIFFRLMTDEFRTANWATSSELNDLTGKEWFNNAVCTAAKAGIIVGMPDGAFHGDEFITRAEFAAIAARFLSEPYEGPNMYKDIEGHWAAEEINRAARAGWFKGADNFRPDDAITRAEVVTIINRMLDRVPDAEHMLEDMIVWTDNQDQTAWYYADIQEATNSHDYDRPEVFTSESWTKLVENRDWAALETEWATAAAAPGEDVMDTRTPLTALPEEAEGLQDMDGEQIVEE